MAEQTTSTPNTLVNLGEIGTINFKIVENSPPNSIFGQILNKTGVQTTPPLARGYVKGSIIDLMNGNLAHVCDFKFIFPDLNSIIGNLGLINPVTAIQDAIRGAKLKATNRLRTMIQTIVSGLRAVLDAVVVALGFDATGIFSFNFSALKKIAAQINSITKKIASAVEAVLEWVFLAQQIVQLVKWVATLPAKLQQMLQDCLTQFGSSIKQVATQIQSIPDQITSLTQAQITNIANEFSAAAKLTLDTVTSTQTNSGIPDAVVLAFNQPPESHVEAVTQAIQEDTAAKAAIIKTYTDSQATKSNLTVSP